METVRELILEDARSILDALWRMARVAQDAAHSLDAMIEDEDLDGTAEAVEVREVLERVRELSLEISEDLNAYLTGYGGKRGSTRLAEAAPGRCLPGADAR